MRNKFYIRIITFFQINNITTLVMHFIRFPFMPIFIQYKYKQHSTIEYNKIM